MTSDASAEENRRRGLADQDRRGYLAHPENADPGSAADQLAAEAWTELDWEE
jgi:hypothetical protein